MSKASRKAKAEVSAAPAEEGSAFPKIRLLLALGLFAVTLWTFFPAIENGFVGYDDPELVTENSRVQAGLSWENVKWAFGTHTAANWHPLTLLSHMLDCQWFGLAAWGHHLVNVVGHALSAVVLFLALERMTGARGRSAAVALLFALHPLRVESVAWVAERKDVLSTVFFLLTVWAYGRYAAKPEIRSSKAEGTPKSEGRSGERPAGSGQRGLGWYWLSLGSFVLGLMSKPMLVTMPFVLLLLDYWPLKRLRIAECGVRSGSGLSERLAGRGVGGLVVEKVPFLVIALAISVITYVVHHRAGDIMTNLSLADRAGNALVSYGRYLVKLFVPAGLAPFYPLALPLPPGVVWGAGLLVAVVTVLAVVAWRARPYVAVGWFWYLGTAVPVIGLVQIGSEAMADRYTYIPCIGVLVVLVWGVHDALGVLRRRVAVEAALLAAASVCCIVMTRQQIGLWRDTETLFRHTLGVTRGNYIAHNNLGSALDKQGRLADAEAEFRKAIAVKPDYARAYNNLGVVVGQQGRLEEAVANYLKAIELQPSYAEAYYHLGLALGEQGRLEDAMRRFKRALELRPDYADARYHLALALARAGRLEESVAEYRETLKLQPGSADAHNNLGVVLDQQGRWEEAAREYREAIRLKPEYARAWFNLGVTLGRGGQVNQAIAALEEALRLQPDYPAAQSNLAQLLELRRSAPR